MLTEQTLSDLRNAASLYPPASRREAYRAIVPTVPPADLRLLADTFHRLIRHYEMLARQRDAREARLARSRAHAILSLPGHLRDANVMRHLARALDTPQTEALHRALKRCIADAAVVPRLYLGVYSRQRTCAMHAIYAAKSAQAAGVQPDPQVIRQLFAVARLSPAQNGQNPEKSKSL